MTPTNKSIYRQGLVFGLVAGVVFAIVEMANAAMMGGSALMPGRMAASVVLGRDALTAASTAYAVGIGLVVHFVLSAMFGLCYALIDSRLAADNRRSYMMQAGMGTLFGALLWLVNFQVIARFAYPWFLDTNQISQVLMHAIGFGLPLGMMCCAAERRALPIARTLATPA